MTDHDHKYTEIRVTKANGEWVYFNITDPEGEPVFLLRAQDKYAARAVTYYTLLLAEDGLVEGSTHAHEHAADMNRWPIKKRPD